MSSKIVYFAVVSKLLDYFSSGISSYFDDNANLPKYANTIFNYYN